MRFSLSLHLFGVIWAPVEGHYTRNEMESEVSLNCISMRVKDVALLLLGLFAICFSSFVNFFILR